MNANCSLINVALNDASIINKHSIIVQMLNLKHVNINPNKKILLLVRQLRRQRNSRFNCYINTQDKILQYYKRQSA